MPAGEQVLALLTSVFLFTRIANADVEVRGQTVCFDGEELERRIASVLEQAQPGTTREALVRVLAQDREHAGTGIALTIMLPGGQVGLERQYELAPEDCPSAPELLLAVISRYLEELPAETWAAPAQAQAQAPAQALALAQAPAQAPALAQAPAQAPAQALAQARPGRGLEYQLRTGVVAPLAPLATEAELGLAASLHNTQHALSLQWLLRSGTTQSIGPGRFRTTAVLAELGWTQRSRWRLGAALRGGAIRIAGTGFDENFARWLPWFEAGASLGYRWRRLEVKAQLLASPLDHELLIQNREESLSVSRLRAGIGLQWIFGVKKL